MCIDEVLENLGKGIKEKEYREPISFNSFLEQTAKKPELNLRSIFQLFHDMVYYYVPSGIDEYPDDPESIKYLRFDCSKLFVEGADNPFFADRLFANRLISLADSFKEIAKQNRFYFFEGPPGSGKSTFLDVFLHKFERFTKMEEGITYETIWALDYEKLKNPKKKTRQTEMMVPCPSHDNPILHIPKIFRPDLLDKLIKDENFKKNLFSRKEYEWVFKEDPCTKCSSLYQSLLDKVGDPVGIFKNFLYARKRWFNRRLGEGISIFNPGDTIPKKPILNPAFQKRLNNFLQDSNAVLYVFSELAKTNNGIYALMDIKGYNKERINNLHGVISDGVHKVESDGGLIEERVNSCFIGVINPEDKMKIKGKSFEDRITFLMLPYVRDYKMEVEIYKEKIGKDIGKYFLPEVLENFSRIIISSRLDPDTKGMKEWIDEPKRYQKNSDEDLLLLKMEIYTGFIPLWLTKNDRDKFKHDVRRKIISEAETEGFQGFSGRQSIQFFYDFFSKHKKEDQLISMDMIVDFFTKDERRLIDKIPNNFLESLLDSYHYTIVEQMEEALYFFSEEQISKDIQHYLFALSYDIGDTKRCRFTGEDFTITEDFLNRFESLVYENRLPNSDQRKKIRVYTHNKYVANTLQEIMGEKKKLTETQQYDFFYKMYTKNLKKNILKPFLENDNFRRAILDYNTDKFNTYEKRVKEDITRLITNLQNKFDYTEDGAKQVSIYVIDKVLQK